MILAVDCATRTLGLALLAEQVVLAELLLPAGPTNTTRLAPAVEALLADAEILPRQIHVVAVTIGPGSFSGLRSGLAWAKGFVLAQGAALIGVSTLQVTAHSQAPYPGALVAVLQAGRGRIAAQQFEMLGGNWVASAAGQVTTWVDLLANCPPNPLVAGEIDPDGAALLAAHNIETAPPHRRVRRPAALAELAAARWAVGDSDDPTTLVPDYWHAPGVTPPGSE